MTVNEIPYISYTCNQVHCRKNETPSRTCSLVPEYNMCIDLLRGCSVSDSFVTAIGDQLALRGPVFAFSVVTLQAVIVVLSDANIVFYIQTRIQSCSVNEFSDTPRILEVYQISVDSKH